MKIENKEKSLILKYLQAAVEKEFEKTAQRVEIFISPDRSSALVLLIVFPNECPFNWVELSLEEQRFEKKIVLGQCHEIAEALHGKFFPEASLEKGFSVEVWNFLEQRWQE